MQENFLPIFVFEEAEEVKIWWNPQIQRRKRSLTLSDRMSSLLRSRFLGCHAALSPNKRLLTSEQHSFPFVYVVCLPSVEQTNHIIAKCE